MDAKDYMTIVDNRPIDTPGMDKLVACGQLQALIEIREALDKQTMALDRLTEEVRAGRNRTF